MDVSQPGNPPAPLGACPHRSHSLPTWARGSGGGSALLWPCLGMGMGVGMGRPRAQTVLAPRGAAPAQGTTSLGEPAFLHCPEVSPSSLLPVPSLSLPRPVLPFLQSSLEADSHWESPQ